MRKILVMAILTATTAGFFALACGGGAPRFPSRAPSSESSSGAATGPGTTAPCARSDCPPCDETKQKCMGPGVCGGHPEKASRQCTRDPDGKCTSKLVCETFSP